MKSAWRVVLACLIVLSVFAGSCLAEEKSASSKNSVCPKGWAHQKEDESCSIIIGGEKKSADFGESVGFLVEFIEFCENGKGECERTFPGVSKDECKDSCVYYRFQGPGKEIGKIATSYLIGVNIVPCNGYKYARKGESEKGELSYLASCKGKELELSFVPPLGKRQPIGCPEEWKRASFNRCTADLGEGDAILEMDNGSKLIFTFDGYVEDEKRYGFRFYEQRPDGSRIDDYDFSKLYFQPGDKDVAVIGLGYIAEIRAGYPKGAKGVTVSYVIKYK